MADLFDTAIRRPIYYDMGKTDGRQRLVRAPMDLMIMKSSVSDTSADNPPVSYLVANHDLAGDNVGLLLSRDGGNAEYVMDRTGLGWVDEILVVDDSRFGSWTRDDIFGQNCITVL